MSRRAARVLMLAVLLVGSSAAACGTQTEEGGGSGSSGSSGTATENDSFLKAWPKAESAVKQLVADPVLLAAGSGGLAFADIPSSWNFSFFAPSDNHIYAVKVEHGKAQDVRDVGEASANSEARTMVEVGSLKVGAAKAVALAREFGEKAGSVPKNVMVGGSFAEMPGAVGLAKKTGVWTVTFASGTDLADAVKFEVDMMSGAVTALEE